MTIIEALKQLRNDLKTWVANNLRTKLDKNLGSENNGKLLSIGENGDITLVDNTGTGSGGSGGVTSWNDLTDKPEFATVATTGLYSDLIGVPTIRELTATDNGKGRVILSYTTVAVGTAIAEESEF